MVECSINGYPVEFTFDTGAELLAMPKRLAALLVVQKAVSPLDFTGEKVAIRSAAGETTKGDGVVFKNFKIGDFVFSEVEGVILPSDSAGVLLGQTVFQRLKAYTVDNANQEIILTAAEEVRVVPFFDCDSALQADLDMAAYSQIGIKQPDLPWSELDFENAIQRLRQLNEKCPGQLPRLGSDRSGKLFEKLSAQPELVASLASHSSGKISQVALSNSVLTNMIALFGLYDDPIYYPEIYELHRQNILQCEGYANLINQIKGDRNLLKPEDMESIKDGLAASYLLGFTLFCFGGDLLGEQPIGELAKKIRLMAPVCLKVVGRPRFKSTVRERAWIFSALPTTEGVRSEMQLLYKELKPEKMEKEAIEEQEKLLEALKRHTGFTYACLSYDGRFKLKAEEKLLEFTVEGLEPKLKIILDFKSGQSLTIRGKQGATWSKVYEAGNHFLFDYSEPIELIIKELVKVY